MSGAVVYSTATNSIDYVEYQAAAEGANARNVVKRVTVKGGTGMSNKHFITPLGVATFVTDEEATFLLANKAFQRHVDRGFMQMRKENIDPEKVVAEGMEPKDKSSPLVPQDYEGDDNDPSKAKPSSGPAKGILQRLTSKWK
jgi:hypothetical protein